MSLTISVEVSDGAETVQLDDATAGMKVVSVSPGERAMFLSEVTSPVMDGSVITSAVVDRQTSTIVVRCYGTVSEMFTTMETLETLFKQLTYTVILTINGKTETWLCGPATTVRGQQGTYQAAQLAGGWQDLVIEIPRQPS